MPTSFKALALALSVHAACSFGGVLFAQNKPPEVPLMQALMDQVPDFYKERAKEVRLSAELQKRYLEFPNLERNVFSLVVSRIAQAPDSLPFLFEAAEKEAVGWRRARLLGSAAYAKEFRRTSQCIPTLSTGMGATPPARPMWTPRCRF